MELSLSQQKWLNRCRKGVMVFNGERPFAISAGTFMPVVALNDLCRLGLLKPAVRRTHDKRFRWYEITSRGYEHLNDTTEAREGA